MRGEVVPYIPANMNQRNNGFGRAGASQGLQNVPADNNWRPVFLCGDKAYVIEGNMARPAPPELLRHELAKTPLGGDVAESLAKRAADAANSHHRYYYLVIFGAQIAVLGKPFHTRITTTDNFFIP